MILKKLRDVEATCDEDAKEILMLFWCPACLCEHTYRIKSTSGQPVWEWNGSMDAPTFTPSLRYIRPPGCHLFITNGKIQFCGDCTHTMAGRTVPMMEIPE